MTRRSALPRPRLSASDQSIVEHACRSARSATEDIKALLTRAARREDIPADHFAQITRSANAELERGRMAVQRIHESGKEPSAPLVTALLALARDGHQYECAVEQWRLLHSGAFATAGGVFDPLEDLHSAVAAELRVWFAMLVASDLVNDLSGERFTAYMRDHARITASGWPRGESPPDLRAAFRAYADDPTPVRRIRLHTVLAALTSGILGAENVRVVETERQAHRQRRDKMERLLRDPTPIDPAAFCTQQ